MKRSWRLGWSRWDREETVVASRDHGNSGSTVVPAPVVAVGSIPLPMSSFPDLVRLFLSLSGPVAQRDVAVGSLLSAAGVTGAGVLPGPATPVACSSVMPAPGVSTPAGAASATASPGRCEHARGSSRPERRRRCSSGRERSCSGGKRGKGTSPFPACSAHLASVSASSSSESSDAEGRVSAMPPPPSGRSGVGGGRCERERDRSAFGHDHSPQLGPSGLGPGERSMPHADWYRGCSSPAPSDAAEDNQDSTSGSVDLDRDDSFRTVLHLISSSKAWRNRQV